MATQKLTPRQRMINMMYLVLIAMLALNVSREILKSFYLFELSFNSANTSTELKNSETMASFKSMMKEESTRIKTEKWFKLAEQARLISSDFYNSVEKMKKDIITRGGGRLEAEKGQTGLTELTYPDNMEEHVYYFMDKGLGNGRKLQASINETRKKLVALVADARFGQACMASLEKSTQLRAEEPVSNAIKKRSWVTTYLEEAPLAGVVTLLTKTQNECKLLEAEVLNILNENITINTVIHDGQMALIIPESRNVMSGELFRAKVALATYDKSSASRIMINGVPVMVKDGIGEYTFPANGIGSHSIKASIESIDPLTGQPKVIVSDPVEWNSFQASATISADNMNVLFIGLDNPMSISIPGFTPENTLVSSNNGISLFNKGNGRFNAKVASGHNTGSVFVSARMADGSIKRMKEMPFRIRLVPKPAFKLGNLGSGTYAKSELLAQEFVYAVLENFYFNGLQFKLTKYRVALLSNKRIGTSDKSCSGNLASGMRSIINEARSGETIIIDNIIATGPNGEIKLEPVTYKIK